MSDLTVSYKRLGATDLLVMRQLNEVFALAFEDTETHLRNLPSDAYLTDLLSQKNVIVLAAFKGREVVGGLVAYSLPKYEQARSEVYIYDLAVAEPHRRQGIARKLILELKPIAKSLGAWVIFVQADKTDTPAVTLYESLGAREEPFHFDISLDEEE